MIADATRPAADRARGIVLSGAAGVGKTRVAREAVAGFGRGEMRRHWIVGTASARGVPLGAFADIASDFGPDPLRRVREVIDGLIGADHNGNVVVGVDDAHLLDDLSAFTIHQLVTRHLATVILTIRTGEPTPDAITAIWKDHHLERLEIQPLSPLHSSPRFSHSPTCTPARMGMPWVASAGPSSRAHRAAFVEPSNSAKTPSPVCFARRPPNLDSIASTSRSWSSSCRLQRLSPFAASSSVEPTMSVNSTVLNTFGRRRIRLLANGFQHHLRQ